MSAKVVSTSKGIKLVATSNEKLIISNDDLIVPSRMKSVKTGDNVYLLFLVEDELFYLLDKVWCYMDVAITIDDELFEEEEYANKTYAIDWENKRIIGHVDNKEALMQFIHKAIITERNEYKAIYSTEYGSEIANTVMGESVTDDYIYAVIPSLIKDCLLVDDRVVDVYDFSITL